MTINKAVTVTTKRLYKVSWSVFTFFLLTTDYAWVSCLKSGSMYVSNVQENCEFVLMTVPI